MSDVRPFRALRPRPELAARVASPPYDVISSEEARKMAEGNEISFLHVNKPEIDLPREVDLYDDRVYATGARNLRRFMGAGVFVREKEPCFYVYQQRMGDHVQAGMVVAASCQEYADGLIKPKAFVVLSDPSKANRDQLAVELQNFVKEKTAVYKYPRWIEFVSELPKTATGKIQRFKLRSSGENRSTQHL